MLHHLEATHGFANGALTLTEGHTRSGALTLAGASAGDVELYERAAARVPPLNQDVVLLDEVPMLRLTPYGTLSVKPMWLAFAVFSFVVYWVLAAIVSF